MCAFDQAGLSSTNGEPSVQPASTIPSTTWSLSLPPLRSIDPLRQFASHPAPGPELSARRPSLGLPPIAQYPPQLTGAPQYYGTPSGCHLGSYRDPGAPNVHMSSVPHASHVPIAPSESHRLIAGGRSKREVKRRTKTGCRTCRKRRIKCDEGQPSCRNCSKSKRECLGYDPIFKSQHPASSSQAPSADCSPPPSSTGPSLRSPATDCTQGWPGKSGPYTIDSLPDTSSQMEPAGSAYGKPAIPPISDSQDRLEDVHGGLHNAEHRLQPVPLISHNYIHIAEHFETDKLFEINDQIPPPVLSSDSEGVTYQQSVEAVYNEVYAPALDKFLETRWYTVSGLKVLRSDSNVLAEFMAYVKAATVLPNEPSPPNLLAQETRLIWYLLNLCCSTDMTSQSLGTIPEDRIGSMNTGSGTFTSVERIPENDTTLPTLTTEDSTTNRSPQSPPYTSETAVANPSAPPEFPHLIPSRRLQSLTSLLTHSPPPPIPPRNQPLIPPSTPLDPPSSKPTTTLARQLQARQDEFWSCIGQYVNISFPSTQQQRQPHHKPPPSFQTQKKAALYRARALLDSRENRDVVYTIMRMRHLQSLASASSAVDADADGDGDGDGVKQALSRDLEKQWRFGMDVLRNEAGLADGGDGVSTGTGLNVVAMRVAAMAVRAFE